MSKKNKFTHYPHRILFIKRGCAFCKMYMGIVQEINFYLKPSKRIKIIDVTDQWENGIITDPIAEHINLKGTPTLYLGGHHPIIVEGMTSRSYVQKFLEGYLKTLGEL